MDQAGCVAFLRCSTLSYVTLSLSVRADRPEFKLLYNNVTYVVNVIVIRILRHDRKLNLTKQLT